MPCNVVSWQTIGGGTGGGGHAPHPFHFLPSLVAKDQDTLIEQSNLL